MTQQLGQITLVVLDYDEAIRYYTQQLNFDLLEDTTLDSAKRWVRVAPKGSSCSLLLAQATTETQKQSVGNQTGGRVFLFLYTDNFWRDYENMKNAGVLFTREPAVETYGTVAVFQDLYGNLWDFIQPAV